MKRTGVVRNHEGYMDLTAYQAIKNIEGEVDKMEIARGDIYEVERPDGEEQFAIVVSSREVCEKNAYVCIVFLCDAKPESKWDVEILARTIMTARCGKIYNAHKNRLGGYLRTANEAEMKKIDDALAKSIGIEAEKDVKYEDDEGEGTREEGREKAIELKETHEQLVRAEAERDVYKNLYERIIGE